MLEQKNTRPNLNHIPTHKTPPPHPPPQKKTKPLQHSPHKTHMDNVRFLAILKNSNRSLTNMKITQT